MTILDPLGYSAMKHLAFILVENYSRIWLSQSCPLIYKYKKLLKERKIPTTCSPIDNFGMLESTMEVILFLTNTDMTCVLCLQELLANWLRSNFKYIASFHIEYYQYQAKSFQGRQFSEQGLDLHILPNQA